jgi:Uma2 family endonuclease
MATSHVATEADLLRSPRDGYKYELVDGEIVMSPAGYRHGVIAVRLTLRLGRYVLDEDLGSVVDSSTGYRLPGGNVRSPDVSFVAKGRFADEQPPVGFPELAPDLAVEVLSPDDDPRKIMDKVGEYLKAGVRLVWVIDPDRRHAAAYRSPAEAREIGPDGELDGEDVLPGFRCRLSEILA